MLISSLAWLLVGSTAADSASAEQHTSQLKARFDRLSAHEDALYADAAIEQARRALHAAASASETADTEPT